MSACPACRAATPEGARFCPSCGAQLAEHKAGATERKVVTTLFADIVGFTALSERSDPEDVDAALRDYFEMAQTTIARFGGIVEKYIGDAVVGVFGVPTAHEDDAERAVRAALAIVEGMKPLRRVCKQELRVRVGVNTGPVLARLTVSPGSAEGILVGDSVNTAARLLAAAPPMAVVAGEKTRSLSMRAIEYDALPPFSAKGKSRPLRAWLARKPIARRGMDSHRETPMVGREVELGILKGLLEKSCAANSPHYLLIVGEAGIGKSRLLREFFRALDESPGFFCVWRQGRCPAYGDGLAYWPLQEIVSSHAGILQTDGPRVVEEKLARALGNVADDQWMLRRMRPLVGLQAAQTEREDNFSAWQRFFEVVARKTPMVVVIEDVHWASDPTLAFLGHLIRHASGAPLLVIGTARPEFLTAHQDIADYADLVTRVDLRALNANESARLARNLPPVAGMGDAAVAVAEACGGNPLFAEELAWYLAEHRSPSATVHDDLAGQHLVATPDSITALISARLDALPEEQRAVLSDASIVGQVFWPGAVAAIGEADLPIVTNALGQLEAREFVRRAADSVQSGEAEFAFWHALTRDVVYERIPRVTRAGKHAAVADWMEEAGGSAAADSPDMLAHHRWTALELAQAAGREDLAARFRPSAIEALAHAGDRALALDVEAARRHFARALDIVPADQARRHHLRVRWAQALANSGSMGEAAIAFVDAIDGLRDLGDLRAASVAMTELSVVMGELEDPHARELSDAAMLALEREGACAELARALEQRAYLFELEGDSRAALDAADRALAVQRELGLPESSRALMRRGIAACEAANEALAMRDLERAVEVARGTGVAAEVSAAYACLAEALLMFRGPLAARAVRGEGIAAAESRHDHMGEGFLKAADFEDQLLSGEWTTALSAYGDLARLLQKQPRSAALTHASRARAVVLALCGGEGVDTALRALAEVTPVAAGVTMGKFEFLTGAVIHQGAMHTDETLRLLQGFAETPPSLGAEPALVIWWPLLLRTALRTGRAKLIDQLVAATPVAVRTLPHSSASVSGLLAERAGEYAKACVEYTRAAACWRDLAVPLEEAEAGFGLGRCLAATGQPAAAQTSLRSAYEIFARLGARPAMASTAAALKRLTSSSDGRARLR